MRQDRHIDLHTPFLVTAGEAVVIRVSCGDRTFIETELPVLPLSYAMTGMRFEPIATRVSRRADGAYTAGPPPDGRSVDEHLDELMEPKVFDAASWIVDVVLHPFDKAPKNATSILAWATDRYGNRRWLVVHWAQGGGEGQPPFRGWFYWSGDGHAEIDPKYILGWLPLPDRAQVKL